MLKRMEGRSSLACHVLFFFQAEDGIRDTSVTGVQTCALPISKRFALSFSGLEFVAQTPVGKIEVRSRLVGRINVYNILAAIGAAIGLGIEREAIEAGIRQRESEPGRFERVDLGHPDLLVVA